MRIRIKANGYLARIRGTNPKYKLERDFLDASAGKKPGTAKTYDVSTDGLYEVGESGSKTYLAVVKGRKVILNQLDILNAGNDLMPLFSHWSASKKTTSSTFAKAVAKVVETAETARRERKKQEAELRKQRVQSMSAREAFEGSSPAETRMFLNRLKRASSGGPIAAELFRSQKASTRAKMYRGEHRTSAYDRKGDSLESLCKLLQEFATLTWGWKQDPDEEYASWVLYVDLPRGQVSFHAVERGSGPDYPDDWDGKHASEDRIIAFCDKQLAPAR